MPVPLGFDPAHARAAIRYFYEKLVWTGFPYAGNAAASSLATGGTTLFDVSDWNETGQPTVQAEIAMIQASQQAATGVTLTFTADPANQRNALNGGDLTAARAGVRFMPAAITAVDRLASRLNNSTGAAIAGFQGNLGVAARRLTVLDKVFATVNGLQSTKGRFKLTAPEKAAVSAVGMTPAQVQALVTKGSRVPFSSEDWLRALIDAHTLQVHDDFFSVAVDSGDNSFATYQATMDPDNPARGRFLVLDRFAAESTPNVLFTVNRDADTDSYWTFEGSAFAQSDDAPWEVVLLGFDHISLHATNGPGASGSSTVGVRVRVKEVAMTDILAVLTGRGTDASQVPGQTFWKAQIGLMSA